MSSRGQRNHGGLHQRIFSCRNDTSTGCMRHVFDYAVLISHGELFSQLATPQRPNSDATFNPAGPVPIINASFKEVVPASFNCFDYSGLSNRNHYEAPHLCGFTRFQEPEYTTQSFGINFFSTAYSAQSAYLFLRYIFQWQAAFFCRSKFVFFESEIQLISMP